MTELLRTLTGLCLMRLAAEMALPEGDGRRYADLGAGLLCMLTLLRALMKLTVWGMP